MLYSHSAASIHSHLHPTPLVKAGSQAQSLGSAGGSHDCLLNTQDRHFLPPINSPFNPDNPVSGRNVNHVCLVLFSWIRVHHRLLVQEYQICVLT